ncbi:MAG: phytanoyl-CoA dioxygenase family protein [Elusimicrobia bacterium]|nr:phytanoyl-CoA dioxygenase family protein [Elusimicrobiota bacterium]
MTIGSIRAAMERDGVARVGRLFPLPLLERIRAEVLRRHHSGELRRRGLVRDIAGRYAAVLPFAGPFLDPRFYANPALHAKLGTLLGPDYCIGSLEAVIAEPGAGRQHQHIDGPVRFDRLVGGRKVPYSADLSGLPPYAVTLAVPLCAVTDENGPTAVWKGSHRAALRPRPPGEREVYRRYPLETLSVPFGEAYLFDFRVFHGGMPNDAPEPRAVLMFVFTRSWYRDPNQNEVFPSVVISERDLGRVPARHRPLFMLAPSARRRLWKGA